MMHGGGASAVQFTLVPPEIVTVISQMVRSLVAVLFIPCQICNMKQSMSRASTATVDGNKNTWLAVIAGCEEQTSSHSNGGVEGAPVGAVVGESVSSVGLKVGSVLGDTVG